MQPGYQPRGPQFGSASPQRWIPAIILIGVGVVFLLDNLNILPVDQVFKFWPLLLIALGLFLLVDRTAWHIGMGRYGGDDSGDAPLGPATGFRYTKKVLSGDTAVLEFETTIDGRYVNGVDIIRCNEAGRIVEFRVMIRPLQAVDAVHRQMAATLERMSPGT